ncbi:MAG TPA: alpha-(1-_3)-arabinofuranosyltransferase family protein [Ilumatobacteraceae bacterium]|nr:alpha-(1->3)-arabinofuranosyltransferase family protein [Ilumatobacteraceae bacterium]
MTWPAGRVRDALPLVLLAVLAYLPVLASSPGRMPADTKLYLYLDPGGLVQRASSTFEPDQFAGWVPFQQITYLWPSGPWYLVFDTVGAPDWVAHRLWIGTILFAAGSGVLWAARRLGLAPAGALIAALVYQLSPYLLPYVSRTSLLLLPWAGLGWIVGLTVRATLVERTDGVALRDRLVPWREPALIALVVATVGSANATTLAMIVPAPVLWLVHAAWQGRLGWARAAAIAARTAVLCLAVSLWWIAMLAVQSRSGAPVLAYTETLADVSRNATGSEVLRNLGYWLFYQRDPMAPTTTASFAYLVSVRAIAVGYAVVIVGILGLVLTRWAQRRYAALCLAAGLVIAVGVHPLDDSSPLMSLLAGEETGLALALRSSTRAVPVLLLGLGLGAGALVSAMRGHASRPAASGRTRTASALVTVGIAALVIANLPSLWNRTFVDPAIDRDQDPPSAWTDAVDHLATTDEYARVLQVPGAEFGAFRWGYTTDHPLVGLTDKPVVTRDLLPLGSAGAMDLLFAVDDRIQDGILEPDAVPAVARLFGADVIWVSNDAAFERFRTARPELVDAALTSGRTRGLGPVERFGVPVVNVPEFEMIDPSTIVESAIGQPLAPVAIVPIADPVPVIRAKTVPVVLSGSGDGIIDAAAAGLLSGYELLRFSGSMTTADALAAAIDDAAVLVVTDTNRDQARHWRGSQDTRGHTEPGGPGDDVLSPTSADQRLAVQPDDAERQTVAIQDGPVRAIASSYGEPFAYRPEDRAVMAVDGDPSTAWRVSDHGDPIGERIRLEVVADDAAVASMRLLQAPTRRGDRSISSIRVTVDDHSPFDVTLDATSRTVGQVVELPGDAPTSIEIEITGVSPGEFPLAASLSGVGFADIDLGLGPTVEFVRPPIDGVLALTGRDTPLALVLTRWRTDPTDPWRADPEPELQRRFELPDTREFDTTVTLRLDRRATDEALAELFASATNGPSAIATARVTGGIDQRGVAALDGDPATAWVTPFDDAVGAALSIPGAGELSGDLVVDQPRGPFSSVTSLRLQRDGQPVDVALPPPDENGRSRVPLPPAIVAGSGPLTVTVTAVDGRQTTDRRYGDPRLLPAAISELTATVGLEPVVVDRSAPVGGTCVTGAIDVDGAPVPISFDTTVGALLDGEAVDATVCGPLVLGPGSHDLRALRDGLPALVVDRIVLAEPTVPPPAPADTLVDTRLDRHEPRARDAVVAPCPDGCWIVLGEGLNDAWSATADGTALGSPVLVDGGFNGWWLPPTSEPTTVSFRWTAQAPVTAALAASAAAAVLCLAVALGARRRRLPPLDPPQWALGADPGPAPSPWAGAVLVVAAGLLIGPIWAVVALGPALLLAVAGRRLAAGRVLEAAGLAAAVTVAVSVMWITRRERPFPDAGWTVAYEHLHGLAVLAVLAVAAGTVFAPDASVADEG